MPRLSLTAALVIFFCFGLASLIFRGDMHHFFYFIFVRVPYLLILSPILSNLRYFVLAPLWWLMWVPNTWILRVVVWRLFLRGFLWETVMGFVASISWRWWVIFWTPVILLERLLKFRELVRPEHIAHLGRIADEAEATGTGTRRMEFSKRRFFVSDFFPPHDTRASKSFRARVVELLTPRMDPSMCEVRPIGLVPDKRKGKGMKKKPTTWVGNVGHPVVCRLFVKDTAGRGFPLVSIGIDSTFSAVVTGPQDILPVLEVVSEDRGVINVHFAAKRSGEYLFFLTVRGVKIRDVPLKIIFASSLPVCRVLVEETAPVQIPPLKLSSRVLKLVSKHLARQKRQSLAAPSNGLVPVVCLQQPIGYYLRPLDEFGNVTSDPLGEKISVRCTRGSKALTRHTTSLSRGAAGGYVLQLRFTEPGRYETLIRLETAGKACKKAVDDEGEEEEGECARGTPQINTSQVLVNSVILCLDSDYFAEYCVAISEGSGTIVADRVRVLECRKKKVKRRRRKKDKGLPPPEPIYEFVEDQNSKNVTLEFEANGQVVGTRSYLLIFSKNVFSLNLKTSKVLRDGSTCRYGLRFGETVLSLLLRDTREVLIHSSSDKLLYMLAVLRRFASAIQDDEELRRMTSLYLRFDDASSPRMLRVISQHPKGGGLLAAGFKTHLRKNLVEPVMAQVDPEAFSKIDRCEAFLRQMSEATIQIEEIIDKFLPWQKQRWIDLLNTAVSDLLDHKIPPSGAGARSPQTIEGGLLRLLSAIMKRKWLTRKEDVVDSLLSLLRRVKEKDVLRGRLQVQLQRRILEVKSVSLMEERTLLLKLKMLFGVEFTSRSTSMLQDKSVSNDMCRLFGEKRRKKKKKDALDFRPCVLSTNFFTLRYLDENRFEISSELSGLLASFQKFYDQQHSGRALTWLFFEPWSTVELCGRFRKECIILTSTLEAQMLLYFNSTESISTEEFVRLLKIGNPQRVSAALEKMESTKLIVSSGDGATAWSVNKRFRSKKRKFALLAGRSEVHRREDAAVDRKALQERAFALDAAIVRIMKSVKICAHQHLIAKTISQVLKTFPVNDLRQIKKRIDYLIERGYLRRCEKQRNHYEYVA